MRIIHLILMFVSLQVAAEDLPAIKKILQQKSYYNLSSYIDSIRQRERSSLSIEDNDIKPLFDEIVSRTIHLTEIIPYNGIGNVNNYRLDILASGDKIIYYRMTSNIYGKQKGKVFPISVIDSFRNEDLYKKIFDDYKSVYEISLIENDLWSSDIVYGWSCGIAGQMPEEAMTVVEFVKLKRVDSIKNWLRSPNPVRQLYAIKAFNMIGRRFLSSKDKEIIKLISYKNVFVPVCNGCIGSRKKLREVLKEIDLERNTHFPFGATVAIALLTLTLLVLFFRRRIT